MCEAEADALLAGDVPCFSVPLDARALVSRSGRRVDDFVPRTPLEDWRQHVEALDHSARQRSVEQIRSALALHRR